MHAKQLLKENKLEDTHQELAICRKNELLLESKIKKLKMKYGKLTCVSLCLYLD